MINFVQALASQIVANECDMDWGILLSQKLVSHFGKPYSIENGMQLQRSD